MAIDAHAHIFTTGIIENIAQKTAMVKRLCLETDQAPERIGVTTLENTMKSVNIEACLILPTAKAEHINKINSTFLEIAKKSDRIYTAGTLHPDYPYNRDELVRFKNQGIRGIKLCSFSQGFILNSPKTINLFDMIREENRNNGCQFFIILDTFYTADIFFGTADTYNTTPAIFGDIVRSYPEIKFIGAHMGGLDAPFKEICGHLRSSENFYLDTSNAAHTLTKNQFVQLLKQHGPEHIAFGTDWPWFGYQSEIDLIHSLLESAGFSEVQKAAVFRNNIAKLLGIDEN